MNSPLHSTDTTHSSHTGGGGITMNRGDEREREILKGTTYTGGHMDKHSINKQALTHGHRDATGNVILLRARAI